jgi:hypothetical protein
VTDADDQLSYVDFESRCEEWALALLHLPERGCFRPLFGHDDLATWIEGIASPAARLDVLIDALQWYCLEIDEDDVEVVVSERPCTATAARRDSCFAHSTTEHTFVRVLLDTPVAIQSYTCSGCCSTSRNRAHSSCCSAFSTDDITPAASRPCYAYFAGQRRDDDDLADETLNNNMLPTEAHACVSLMA